MKTNDLTSNVVKNRHQFDTRVATLMTRPCFSSGKNRPEKSLRPEQLEQKASCLPFNALLPIPDLVPSQCALLGLSLRMFTDEIKMDRRARSSRSA